MTDTFSENGFTIQETSNGLTISPDGGSSINITIPDYSSAGVDFDASGFHGYVRTHKVMSTSSISSQDVIWQNLLEEPFPTFGLFGTSDPVTNGDSSNVPSLGSVNHYLDSTNHVVSNVTQDGHALDPGIVVRYLYEKDGDYYITTIGVGNGALPSANEALSDWVWGNNVDRIKRESIYEDNQPNNEFFNRVNRAEASGGDSSAEDTDTPIDDVKDKFEAAKDKKSPLVLDIDGDGIELTSLNSADAVYWDHNLDGFAEASGWISGGDGFLAIDLNEDGIINNSSEMFGDQTGYENGFRALAAYDTNADGLITAEDADFEKLLVWIDNGDGFSWHDELYTLSDLLITSIDLGYADVNTTIAGNDIRQESTFTINGNTRDITDVYFSISTVNSVYDTSYVLDFDTLGLPTNRGYGTLADLHIAMSMDNDGTGNLLSLVQGLAGKSFANIFTSDTSISDDVKDILFRWAGVDGLFGDERGPNVDSRELGFLEKLMGQDFLQRGAYSNPAHDAGDDLQEAFYIAFNNFYARLLAQSAGGELFTGDWYYNIATDSFEGVTGIDTDVLDLLETEATGLANTGEREVFWANVIRMVEYSVGVSNLPSGDQTALNDAIYASDNTLSLSGVVDSLDWVVSSINDVNGTSGNDTLNGTSGRDDIDGDYGDDVLNGGADNDTLNGQGDDDILTGGTGNDYIKGGSGDDAYVYNLGDGYDTYTESSSNTGDKILFGAGIDSGDITLVRALNNTDLMIEIDTGTQMGLIVIEDQFNYAAGGGHIETIEFYDTSTIDLGTINFTLTGTSGNDVLRPVKWGGGTVDTIYGGDGHDDIEGHDGNDTLYGEDGNDEIDGGDGVDTIYGGNDDDTISGGYGNDLIYDGAGNDWVSGGLDNDTYYFGGGHDTYVGGQTETIILPSGFTSGSTLYYKFGSDMQIVLDANNSIYVPNYATAGFTVVFDGGPSVLLTSVSPIVQGDSGNNTLNGTNNADTLYGNGGDDWVKGNDGNDFLYGGTGDDELEGGYGNDWLEGGAGDDRLEGGFNDDIMVFTSGHDEIYDLGGSDEIRFIEGWTAEDLTFARYLADTADLVIEINEANSIYVIDHFTSGRKLETIRFADNSTIDMQGIGYTTHGTSAGETIYGYIYGGNGTDIIYGYGGNDTIYGRAGNDIIYGGDGNDTIVGDEGDDIIDGGAGDDHLTGHSGNDTFIYTAGLDTIVDMHGGTDKLVMGEGIDVNAISFTNTGSYSMTIIVDSAVDEVYMYNIRHPNANYKVETIEFADGFKTSLPDFASWVWGTSGNDLIAYSSADDTIVGLAGNDEITAGAGNDDVHGGAGDDNIEGQDGDDLLHGGGGDDILYGGDGLDTLFGGAGEDTFVFESASAFNDIDVISDFSLADDAIDLSDLLSGYDPMTDVITDFIEMTTSGSDTVLKVDMDGTGGTYSLTQIATLSGVTGLTDEAALVTNGNLIVS